MQQYPRYKVTASDAFDVIEFTSTGIKGSIDKIIHIEPTHNPLIFNLAFGDKIKKVRNNETVFGLDDKINSENGDRNIALATVAGAAYDYTSKYPERWLIFSGSNEIRTRLYRMAITINYAELSKDFYIFGVTLDNDLPIAVRFDSNCRFDGFLVKRKIKN